MKPHLPLLLRAALMACFAPLVANAVCIPDLNAPIKVISPAVNGGSYRAGGCGWSYYHRTISGLSLHGSSEYHRGAAFYACGWDEKSIWKF